MITDDTIGDAVLHHVIRHIAFGRVDKPCDDVSIALQLCKGIVALGAGEAVGPGEEFRAGEEAVLRAADNTEITCLGEQQVIIIAEVYAVQGIDAAPACDEVVVEDFGDGTVDGAAPDGSSR